MSFDITKSFRCRNGTEAGATWGPDGRLYGWRISEYGPGFCVWESDGTHSNGLRFADLINIPQHRTLDVWVNVLEEGFGYPTKEAAHAAVQRNGWKSIACLHIIREFEEGEGL